MGKVDTTLTCFALTTALGLCCLCDYTPCSAAEPSRSRIVSRSNSGVGTIGQVPKALKESALACEKGRALYAKGKKAEALGFFSEAIAVDPTCIGAYLERSRTNRELKRLALAYSDAQAALKIDQKDPYAWDSLGLAAVALGRLDFAVSCYGRAIAYHPAEHIFYTDRAEAYLILGRNSLALADAERAVGLDRVDPLPIYRRGCAYEAMSQFDNALADYDRAFKMDPRYYFLISDANLQRKLRHYDAAIEKYSVLMGLIPDYPWVRNAIGICQLAKLRIPEALRTFNKAVKLDPNLWESYSCRSEAYLFMSDFQNALKDAEHAISLNSKNAMPYYRKARACEGLKRNEEALENYDRAISIDPRDYFLGSKALLLFRLGRYAQAVKCDDLALARGSKEYGLRRLRSTAYARDGDLEQAVIEYGANSNSTKNIDFEKSGEHIEQDLAGYSEVLKLFPADVNMRYNRAVAYICLGRYDNAAADLSQFLQECKYPGTRTVAACLAHILYKQLGKSDLAKKALLLPNLEHGAGWRSMLVKYMNGTLSEHELLSERTTADDRCRMILYIGLNQLVSGDISAGKTNLQFVISHADPKIDEYSIACAYKNHMSNIRTQK